MSGFGAIRIVELHFETSKNVVYHRYDLPRSATCGEQAGLAFQRWGEEIWRDEATVTHHHSCGGRGAAECERLRRFSRSGPLHHTGRFSRRVKFARGTQAHNSEDVTFAQRMIAHHQQAVHMSDIILGKPGIDPRVVDLANRIKAAQGPEIQQMLDLAQPVGSANEPDDAEQHDTRGA